jgi:hypothetical protein
VVVVYLPQSRSFPMVAKVARRGNRNEMSRFDPRAIAP